VHKETREVTRRRFTVHEYHRMGDAGITHEDDRIELLDGELVEMAAIGTRHFSCVNRLNHLLVGRVGDDVIVSVQNPVRLNEYTEPQPDVALIRARDYSESLPTPDDVLLLIEVSDTTLAYDRGLKLSRYAQAGIPEVWTVDLEGENIEHYTGPSGDLYRHVALARRGETLQTSALPSRELRVTNVLG
jgi:Uma2 family endonuclease